MYFLFYHQGTVLLDKQLSIFCFQMSLCRCAENPYSIFYLTTLIKYYISLTAHQAFSNILGENKHNSIIKIRHEVRNALNYYNMCYKHNKDAFFKFAGHLFNKYFLSECITQILLTKSHIEVFTIQQANHNCV